jgi:NADH-quinone oxidoreductase subunit E
MFLDGRRTTFPTSKVHEEKAAPAGMDIHDILKEAGNHQRDILGILHRIQTAYGRIPAAAIPSIARHLHLSPSEVFGVLTFYKSFSLESKGEFTITVCLGTACHVRGGAEIVEAFERKLGIKAGRTTPDHRFSLETVNCLGCCAIGPFVVVNGTYYPHATAKTVEAIVDVCRGEEGPA